MFDARDRVPIEAYGDINAWQRLLVRVFRRPRREKESVGVRLRRFALKPPKPGAGTEVPVSPKTIEEVRAQAKSASDKERLIGLLVAPWAAGIGIVITNALISNNPAATLADGAPNKLHVSVSLYHEVEIALLGLSLVVLIMAWLRKRLYVGIALALYGLTVFNLHYWGFGIPFLLIGVLVPRDGVPPPAKREGDDWRGQPFWTFAPGKRRVRPQGAETEQEIHATGLAVIVVRH